jgi:hypothetical protein
VRRGAAGPGMVRTGSGLARSGAAGPGPVWHGADGVRLGLARPGLAGLGRARPGADTGSPHRRAPLFIQRVTSRAPPLHPNSAHPRSPPLDLRPGTMPPRFCSSVSRFHFGLIFGLKLRLREHGGGPVSVAASSRSRARLRARSRSHPLHPHPRPPSRVKLRIIRSYVNFACFARTGRRAPPLRAYVRLELMCA